MAGTAVISFNFLKSTQTLTDSSFLRTHRTGDAHGDTLGSMAPVSSHLVITCLSITNRDWPGCLLDRGMLFCIDLKFFPRTGTKTVTIFGENIVVFWEDVF